MQNLASVFSICLSNIDEFETHRCFIFLRLVLFSNPRTLNHLTSLDRYIVSLFFFTQIRYLFTLWIECTEQLYKGQFLTQISRIFLCSFDVVNQIRIRLSYYDSSCAVIKLPVLVQEILFIRARYHILLRELIKVL